MTAARKQTATMGSGENADVVRRGYAAFNTADVDALMKIFDENSSWHTPGRGPIGGNRKGRDAVFTQFGRYGGETKGTFKADLLSVFESDDARVIGLHRNTGERNGKHLDVMCCIVFEVKDGRISAGKEHFFDLYAWDEFRS
jgi:ketosteroid isomerase-like protein